MKKSGSALDKFVWGILILVIAVIAGTFVHSKLKSQSPLPVIGQISDFKLVDQDGSARTLADLKGKVWVADVVFTRCPGPCAGMTRHLAEIQALLPPGDGVRLVTLTSDPENDTPEVLKKYSQHFGADNSRWFFLTGPKAAIRHLEINDFKFVVVEKDAKERESEDDLFIHSTWFVLVDKQGRLRGWTDDGGSLHAYYDSTEDDARALLVKSVARLLREE
jgi:protein SCO1/2